MSNNNSNKTFYFHTPELMFPGWHIENRATIACRLEGDKIKYGISICSAGDNFSREKGRLLSSARLEDGYGSCDYNNGYYDTFKEIDHALLEFAKRLGLAVQRNFSKHKRKIGSWTTKRINA